MKKLLLSTALLTLTTGVALAADLPTRKEPLMPPPPMWTGFYAGLNAGYSFGTNSNSVSQNWGYDDIYRRFTLATSSMDGVFGNTQSGFMGGAQFGYNYQYGSNIVLGIETDIQGAGVTGKGRSAGAHYFEDQIVLPFTVDTIRSTETNFGTTRVNADLSYLGTVRGRIGYLFTPTLLAYGTGGFAYGGASAEVTQTMNGFATDTATPFVWTGAWNGGGQQNQLLTGWTAGGGLEWMFMPNWSLKAEALYWNLGNMTVNTATYSSWANAWGGGRTTVNFQGVSARAGINYHFNFGGPAPVVAKY